MNNDDLRAGTVWHVVNFPFGDGEAKNKYLILLTHFVSETEAMLFAKTTSKFPAEWDWSGDSPCGTPKVPAFRIRPPEEACFPVPTLVLFTGARELLPSSFRTLNPTLVASLVPARLRSIWNCALNSGDLERRCKSKIEKAREASNTTATAKARPVVKTTSVVKAPPGGALTAEDIHANLNRAGRSIKEFCELAGLEPGEFGTLSGPLPPEVLADARAALDLLLEK